MKQLSLLLIFSLITILSFAQLKIENNQLLIDKPVVFKTGTAELAEENDATLKQVKSFLESKKYISLLRIEGHVNADASEGQTLSEKRALAVYNWLVKNGVDCKRIIATGFGSSKPVADNTTAEGKTQNSRIVFALAALNGKAIGGMPLDGGGKMASEFCE